MKYAVIESYQHQHSVSMMCRLLSVSTSAFYDWLNRKPSEMTQRRALVERAVELNYDKFKKRYGASRLAVELTENEIPCSVNFVAKLLKEKG